MDPSKLPTILDLLKDDPTESTLLLSAGQIYLQLQKWNEALELLSRCAQHHPKYMAVYRELGRAYEGRGEMQKARDAYERGRQVSLEAKDYTAMKEYEERIAGLG